MNDDTTRDPTTATYGGILMDTRPWLYADTAADALRRLQHCTDQTDVEGWEYPRDGYRVVGHLVTLMQRVPELLAGVEYLIAGHDQEIKSVAADDTPAELRALYAEITEAQTAARTTVAALGRLHARLGTLEEKPQTPSDQDSEHASPWFGPEGASPPQST